MYPPKHYSTDSKNNKQLTKLIADYPLATLLIKDERELHISHIPFHYDENELFLIGHVSNHHPLSERLKNSQTVHVSLIFHGEDAYISPSYVSQNNKSKQSVPTWNYRKVHISGEAIEISNHNEKYQQMDLTSQLFEQGQDIPWLLKSAPSKAIKHMLNAITIFKVTINTCEGRFKLSQNKTNEIKMEISEQLKLSGKNKLAERMLE
ncbi:FMN-binding negative transcriptional regulator [Pseudoalteromonas denitrificans]|uniref:Negative transcriptional regulator, PaiB family n=1 Tax=Pseudoalteromonas denitrificans DSM 6059 TaxID=1123010 RepID=A0A1I1REL1_9GAMM|nr:FMN-binding negative transcriptional regulator [Pseudoalteromonas denitrificans]SFD28830.1 negative transcriptional regulator, PaiB family [Pseudoalteromonas denitrificans DSM 6059]